jgi:hypothetical protein
MFYIRPSLPRALLPLPVGPYSVDPAARYLLPLRYRQRARLDPAFHVVRYVLRQIAYTTNRYPPASK